MEKIGLPSALARDKLLAQSDLIKNYVEKIGLEPTTSWLPAKRSSQLSYIPNFINFQPVAFRLKRNFKKSYASI